MVTGSGYLLTSGLVNTATIPMRLGMEPNHIDQWSNRYIRISVNKMPKYGETDDWELQKLIDAKIITGVKDTKEIPLYLADYMKVTRPDPRKAPSV